MLSGFYLNLSLLLIVLISKEFLIFNEEILVLSAFGLFIHLVVTGVGQTSAEELIARGSKLKVNFDFYKNLQIKGLVYLLKYNINQLGLPVELSEHSILLGFEISALAKLYPKSFYNSIFSIGSVCFKRSINSGTEVAAKGQLNLFKAFYNINI